MMSLYSPNRAIYLAVLLWACGCSVFAQDKAAPKPDAKAEEIVQKAIVAVGGPAYLNVKTTTGRGQYTPFDPEKGAGVPSSFVDFIAWPDRERTEFKSGQGRLLQVNTGGTGWLFEGSTKTFKAMTPAQAADFKRYIRTTTDNLLRGFWRQDGAQLSYVGRREAGLAKRNEVVRLTYADGFEVEYEFGAKDFLPAKTLHRNQDAEGVTAWEEDRFAQFVMVGGVNTPFIIDHYRAGKQSSRVNYEAIEFNRQFPNDLFTQPANPKAVKWNF